MLTTSSKETREFQIVSKCFEESKMELQWNGGVGWEWWEVTLGRTGDRKALRRLGFVPEAFNPPKTFGSFCG